MADFTDIIQEINTNLPNNNTQSITAEKLRTTLIDLTNTIDTVQDDFENNVNQTISDLPSNLIVDNLITDNSTKALSAKQGKILNDNQTIYDSNVDFTLFERIINSSNEWTVSQISGCMRIPVSEGEEFFLEVPEGNTQVFQWAWLKNWYSSNIGTDATLYYCEGTSLNIDCYGSVNTGAAPSDATYLYVRNKYQSNTINFSIYRTIKVKNVVERLEGELDSFSDEFDNVQLQSNVLNFFINVSEVFKSATSSSNAVVYPVKEGNKYIIEVPEGNTQVFQWAWLTSINGIANNVSASNFYPTGSSLNADCYDSVNTGIAPPGTNYLYVRNKYNNLTLSVIVSLINIRYEIDEIEDTISDLSDSVSELETENRSLKHIYLGSLKQRNASTGGVDSTDNPNRVCNGSVCTLPYPGVKFNIKTPSDVMVSIRAGAVADNLATTSGVLGNGSTYTFSNTRRFYIVYFTRPDTSNPISVSDVQNYIDNGDIEITYEDNTPSIIQCNLEAEKYIKSIRRVFDKNANPNISSKRPINGNYLRLPSFIHSSDLHGDNIRLKRMMEYADYMECDCALLTGDFIAYTGSNYMDYVHDIIDESKTMGLICAGNHDAYVLNSTIQNLYNNVMKRNIDKFECVVNSLETYPTYFYKDLTDKQIRIISINSYEGEFNHSTSCYYSQNQINWLISTLQNTPENYGVIIMYHSPENIIQKVEGYEKFYQDDVAISQQYQSSNFDGYVPIAKIVDAFVSGTTLDDSFQEGNLNNSPTTYDTININADFTNKNSGVEFICFVCGHEHSDRIGYVTKTVANGIVNNLLVMNICCGTANYAPEYGKLAELSDLPRQYTSVIQDSFNYFVVDRENHNVRIARVGSNMNSKLKMRDYMEIPYV